MALTLSSLMLCVSELVISGLTLSAYSPAATIPAPGALAVSDDRSGLRLLAMHYATRAANSACTITIDLDCAQFMPWPV
jgi:hypothetical protein